MLERPFSFGFTFLGIFALAVFFMAAMDALPESPAHTSDNTAAITVNTEPASAAQPAAQPVATQGVEEPVRIVAKDIGLDVKVVNPATTSVSALDTALEQGAVRYPTSAELGQEGTVLIFGHSSYLPIVYHQYYKTFDGIQNLKAGEVVSVYSGSTEYRYSVTGVTLANADQDVIELPQSGQHLVLVTCDSFATKSTRYIVRADLVGAYAR